MTEPINTPWVIELRSAKFPKPLQVQFDEQLIIGRAFGSDDKEPNLDLAPYGAEDTGVSRQHARIFADKDRLMVEDLGSGNGTFLNNNRLNPYNSQPLEHEDQLQLGLFKLQVFVLVSPTYGGDVHRHPSLQLQDQVHPGRGQLVLIVEDDPQVAKVLSMVMERAGYQARVVNEVVNAIKTFNKTRPSAILLDLMLPGLNGLEFCRYVRRDVRQNTIPVIIVSAANTESYITEAMSAGANIYLTKPVSARELRHVVSSLIAQHESDATGMHTKHLVGTAPLTGVQPETRRHSTVLFVAGYSDAPIIANVQPAVSFGRDASVPGPGIKQHVDLRHYDAVNYGVSRLHMVLHNKDGKFFIEDMGTVNGTYLNGSPLKPHELAPVENADEIRLGRLRLYIYFLEDREGASS